MLRLYYLTSADRSTIFVFQRISSSVAIEWTSSGEDDVGLTVSSMICPNRALRPQAPSYFDQETGNWFHSKTTYLLQLTSMLMQSQHRLCHDKCRELSDSSCNGPAVTICLYPGVSPGNSR